jgi:hypothetical protein
VVAGDCMTAKFSSDHSSNDWGYKFTGLQRIGSHFDRISKVFSQVYG